MGADHAERWATSAPLTSLCFFADGQRGNKTAMSPGSETGAKGSQDGSAIQSKQRRNIED